MKRLRVKLSAWLKWRLWRLGLSTATDYQLLLDQVVGLRARVAELQSSIEARRRYDSAAHAQLCEKVEMLDRRTRIGALEKCLPDAQRMGGLL